MAFTDDVKAHANANADDDLTTYIGAAEAYLTNAGIAVAESNALYTLAVGMMVSQWYDNRTTKPESSDTPQPRGLDGIILQLQMSQEAT